MSALVNALVAGRHQRLLGSLLWAVIFAVLLAMGYGFVIWQVGSHIDRDQRAELARINGIRDNAVAALKMLQQGATAPPCSSDFLAQLRRVAFLPDGLNEFLYAPNGRVVCSTSHSSFNPPVLLGTEDIPGAGQASPSWRINRDLGPIGRPGTIGTIAHVGDFAVAIPPYTRYEDDAPWLRKELIVRGDGSAWHIAGHPGLYQSLADSPAIGWLKRLVTVRATTCDGERLHCVGSQANLLAWARDWFAILASTVILAALFAWICANNIVAFLKSYWSFEARFLRRLDAKSIAVAYQPIIDVRSNAVVGVEALARWVDVDGTTVGPQEFIDIVARTGRTTEFTQLLVDRAFAELDEQLPSAQVLEINFNVFACDFDARKLLKIFSRFLKQQQRFRVAVELVEFHDIDFDEAQRTVVALADAGIRTYIDDFGTGYSSIERVAKLAVDGVKLDRSFAMSPPDSIMGRMLVQVIEIIKTSGRKIIVEGVETVGCLDLLRSTGLVDYVQGYVIARPLGINELGVFLRRGGAPWTARGAAA